jgi:tRNA threonylcarbamoyl adenosine modification protein (Sua5/YciO/YrdC/YwlC family)
VTEPATDASYQRFDCTGTDSEALAAATEAARLAVERGKCIVLPTDTVYGIGADAFHAEAVQRLLDAKQRGRDMPPPVLIGEPSLLRALAVSVPAAAKDLVAAHWPGALTVICKAQPSLRMDLGDTEGTIALRVPDHELAREILRRTGPMAVSSANVTGAPAATTCDDAVAQLGDRIAVYLDGGALGGSASGTSSTIVDFTNSDDGEVLRRGALSLAVLRESCPDLVDLTEPEREPEEAEPEKKAESEKAQPEKAQPEDADAVELDGSTGSGGNRGQPSLLSGEPGSHSGPAAGG